MSGLEGSTEEKNCSEVGRNIAGAWTWNRKGNVKMEAVSTRLSI